MSTTFKTLNAATKLAVSSTPCTLIRVQGYFKHTADAWLHIYDAASEPVEDSSSVPVKSYQLTYDSPYSWAFDPSGLRLNTGCYIAVSENEGYYDKLAYSAGVTYCDIQGEYEEGGDPAYATPGNTAISTMAQAAAKDVATVWSSGNHRLLSLTVTNGEAVAGLVCVFASEPVAGTTVPVEYWPIAAGETKTWSFGVEGRRVYSGSNTKCYVGFSTSLLKYTPTGNELCTFDATYL